MDALTRLATSLKRLNIFARLTEAERRLAETDARIERHTVSANRRHAAMCAADGDYERRS